MTKQSRVNLGTYTAGQSRQQGRAVTARRTMRPRRSLRVAQGDRVGLGYVIGLDGSQTLAQALASLAQQLE